jgi:hypothetical protein
MPFKTAINGTLQPACVLREQRRDACPLLIEKPKQIRHLLAIPLEDRQLRFS